MGLRWFLGAGTAVVVETRQPLTGPTVDAIIAAGGGLWDAQRILRPA